MQTAKRLLAILFISAIIMSCSKSDDNSNIVSKNGIVMSGDQEVPAKVSGASGSFDVSYDKTTRMLTYTVNWSSLTTIPTGSHIHGTAVKGVNAGIVHNFFAQIPKTQSGTFTNSVLIDGVLIKEDSLLNGYYYMNIHTTTNPGGEIRGQIDFK